jgi:hypothetical protein
MPTRVLLDLMHTSYGTLTRPFQLQVSWSPLVQSKMFLLLQPWLPTMTRSPFRPPFCTSINHYTSPICLSTSFALLSYVQIRSLSMMYHYCICHTMNGHLKPTLSFPPHPTLTYIFRYYFMELPATLKFGSRRSMRSTVSTTVRIFT